MAPQQGRAAGRDQHQRGGRGRCPAPVPEQRRSSGSRCPDQSDAPAQVRRGFGNRLLGQGPREVLLQRELALAPRAGAQVLPDGARLVQGQLAVGERGNPFPQARMLEGSFGHVATPRFI